LGRATKRDFSPTGNLGRELGAARREAGKMNAYSKRRGNNGAEQEEAGVDVLTGGQEI